MRLAGRRTLVTGASGGIGRATAILLAERGAALAIQGRDAERLAATRLAAATRPCARAPLAFEADLERDGSAEELVAAAARALGGLDLVVNVAGQSSFASFEHEDPEAVESLFRVNVLAPMRVARAALPHLRRSGGGRIVNVGSVFGSIGFPWFASYAATKFALRGFSEALRRELHGSGIGVTHVAPRATRTAATRGYEDAATAAGMRMDAPERVAERIARAIETDAADVVIGFPESLFVRVNAVLPRLVDRALRGQTACLAPFARARHRGHDRPAPPGPAVLAVAAPGSSASPEGSRP